jgi:hypothetical protein
MRQVETLRYEMTQQKKGGDSMEIMTTREAGSYLKVSVHTLAAWRCKGSGPQFVRTGRTIKYLRKDLDRFLQQNEKAYEYGDKMIQLMNEASEADRALFVKMIENLVKAKKGGKKENGQTR